MRSGSNLERGEVRFMDSNIFVKKPYIIEEFWDKAKMSFKKIGIIHLPLLWILHCLKNEPLEGLWDIQGGYN